MPDKNALIVKYYMSRQREKEVPVSDTDENEKVMMTETRIYVGLNDAETREQKFKTEKYMSILKNVCKS